MLDFRTIELSDSERIKKLLSLSDYRGCEYCFANNFAWHRLADTKIAFYKDFYISCSFKYGIHFTYPAGKGDIADIIGQMREYAESNNSPLIISSVCEEEKRQLASVFGSDSFTVEQNRDSYDYIYNVSDLVNLSGRKYHSKRNHLSKFRSSFNYTFDAITENDFDDCIKLAALSYNEKSGYDSDSAVAEQYAINAFFNHYNELSLVGGILRVDGAIAAFSIGERINSDTIGVHIEKADTSFEGSFTAVNNEFLKMYGGNFTYVNREEDMGIDGLRKAKQSYYPAFMQIKNTITFK